jgi:hypothetical protein
VRQSRLVCINICFFFNLFFSDAPCDPSMPSSEYTQCNRLQNVLASINHHILYIASWIKSGIIYSIHIPFFSCLRIKFTTISLLFSPSGISPSKKKPKKNAWPHQFWRNSLTRNTFINFVCLTKTDSQSCTNLLMHLPRCTRKKQSTCILDKYTSLNTPVGAQAGLCVACIVCCTLCSSHDVHRGSFACLNWSTGSS